MTQAQPTHRHLTITPQRLASVDAARRATGFGVRMPTAIPPGYRLEVIDHALHRTPGEPRVDFLMIYFRAAGDDYLKIEQGFQVAYDRGVYRFAPANQRGTTMVQGQPAVWYRGRARMTAQGPQWELGPLSLRWQVEMVGTEGNYIGYGLDSNALTLEQLVVIANSVRPLP